MLAAAEDDIFVDLGLEQHRFEFGASMRAVAERLLARSAAAAPEIALTGFHFAVKAFAMGDRGSGHLFRHPNKCSRPDLPSSVAQAAIRRAR